MIRVENLSVTFGAATLGTATVPAETCGAVVVSRNPPVPVAALSLAVKSDFRTLASSHVVLTTASAMRVAILASGVVDTAPTVKSESEMLIGNELGMIKSSG